MKRQLVLAVAVLGSMMVGAQAASAAVLLNFNDGSGVGSQFANLNDGVSGSGGSFSHNATIGVGGSGGIAVPQSTSADRTKVYDDASYNLTTATAGSPISISIFFKIPTTIGTPALITAAQIGFTANINGTPITSNVPFVSTRVRSTASGTTYFMEGQYQNASGGAVNINTTGNFVLTAGNWYKLTGTYTNRGDSTGFSYSSVLDDYGVSGTSLVTASIQSISSTTTMNASSLSTDTTAWAFFRANGNAQNKVFALDNFAINPTEAPVIPEPASLGVLALGGLALLARRRK